MVDKEAVGRSSNRNVSSNLTYYLLDSAVETVVRLIKLVLFSKNAGTE